MNPAVCIFAGSRLPNEMAARDTAKAYGKNIGGAGCDLIYGGGTESMMGIVASAAQESGLQIIAVVLRKYADEKQLDGAQIIFVDSEAERFAIMSAQPGLVGYIAFPGGPGTLREVMQGLESAVYENGIPVLLTEVGNSLNSIWNYFTTSIQAGLIKAEKANSLRQWKPHQHLRDVLNLATPVIPSTTDNGDQLPPALTYDI
jgi:uncharacterized protein (TIGR00730 family)